MRARTTGRRAALAALTGVLALGPAAPVALADPGDGGDGSAPTRSDVRDARRAAGDKARSVAAVQADLVLADQRRQAAGIRSAQAFEAWNAARWDLREARREVREAEARSGQAQDTLAVHETAYAEVLAAAYEMSPEVTTLSAIVDENGIDGVVAQANAMYTMTSSMDEVQGSYEAALSVADLTGEQAAEARAAAEELAAEASSARDVAVAEEQAAAQEAALVEQERATLIAELAQLQDISVSLASERQAALEQAAQERLAAAAAAEQQAAEQAAAEAAAQAADSAPAAPAQPAPQQSSPQQPNPQPNPQPQPAPQPQPGPAPQPSPSPQPTPTPPPPPPPAPAPDPTPPPASTTGAQRAISFARAQLGDPYRWGATGPSSWDCSGLTMRAWEKGGKWIGRTSRQQYAMATPISSSQLRPGDLLFWTSGGGSGIYHVAMYTGGGRMIHAPNSSRPVVEESMYSWPPSLYARP